MTAPADRRPGQGPGAAGPEPERYLVDRAGPPDPEVARLERLLGRYRHRAATPEPGAAPRVAEAGGAAGYLVSPRVLRAAIAAAAVFVAAMLLVRALRPPSGGWAVRGVDGVAVLSRGEWLEAGAGGAALAVGALGELGSVRLEPGARVRLDDEGRDVHALYLARGELRATIDARPRAFQIGTPAGLSVDLGCIYTLAVDDDGASRLAVEWGQVAFETGGRTVFVPEGYATRALPGAGPEVPLPVAGDPERAALVRRLEGPPPAAPEDVAAVARIDDPVVLYHLLRAPAPAVREAALAALLPVEPLPAGLTAEAVLADAEAWLAWHDEISWRPIWRR